MPRKKARLNRDQRASLKSLLSKLTHITAVIDDVDIKVELKIAISALVNILSSVKGYYKVIPPTLVTKAIMLKSYGLPDKVIMRHLDLTEHELDFIYGRFIRDKRLTIYRKRNRKAKPPLPKQGELF